MEKRVAVMAIVIDDTSSVEALNAVLHDYSDFIIGRMGLLKGRDYTCFTPQNEDFGGTYHHQHVVVDGKLITARAMAASIDYGLKLVEVLGSVELCQQVKERIYY